MAGREKGTFAKAQSSLLKALRDFQTAISEITVTGEKPKKRKRSRKRTRKAKAKRR
jgi:hypothetical protein